MLSKDKEGGHFDHKMALNKKGISNLREHHKHLTLQDRV